MKKYLLLTFLLLPFTAIAQTTVKTFHQTLPFLNEQLTTENFLQALYNISIAVAAGLVVIRLIWAGAQYMLSDVVTKKGQAVKEMQGAVLGLLIILAAVTILQTINPRLLELNVIGQGEVIGIGDNAGVVSADSVNFRPGNERSHAAIRNYCANDSQCMGQYVSALRNSCINNGGSSIREDFAPSCSSEGNWLDLSCDLTKFVCVQ